MMDTIRNIKKALIAGGVSWRHVQRYGVELQHHYEDLLDKARATGFDEASALRWAEKQLGDPEVLVKEMTSRPELQCFGNRYPKLVFLAMPVVSFMLVLVVIILTIVAYMQQVYPSAGGPYDYGGGFKLFMESLRLFMMHALAPLLSCGFLVYGLRQNIPRKWLYTGVFLVNLLGCAMLISIVWPDPFMDVTEGSIGAMVGYGLYSDTSRGLMDTKFRLLLTLVPLALFAWWYRKRLGRE